MLDEKYFLLIDVCFKRLNEWSHILRSAHALPKCNRGHSMTF